MGEGGVRCDRVEAGHLMPEPGFLALGIGTGVGLAFGNRIGKGQAALEMGDQARHAVGAHDRQGRIELARCQCLHFRKGPCGDHGRESFVDAAAERRPVDAEENGPAGRHSQRRRAATVGLPMSERPAGRDEDLERPQHALRIVRPQPRRRFRIEGAQALVQGRGRQAFGFGPQALADRVGHGRNVR